MSPITLKTAVLSIIYFLLVIIVLLLMDVALGYFLQYVLFKVLDWFNGISLFFKISLLFIGGTAILAILTSLFRGFATGISHIMFKFFPVNAFTSISSLTLCIINTASNIIGIWRMAPYYDFWIVVELMWLSGFVWTLNSVVIGKNVYKTPEYDAI
jgi:hypothetical protein